MWRWVLRVFLHAPGQNAREPTINGAGCGLRAIGNEMGQAALLRVAAPKAASPPPVPR